MKYIEIHVWSTLGWQQLSFGDYIRHRFGSLTAENSLCSIKGPSCEPNPPCEAESLCLLEAIREASAGVPFVRAPVFGQGRMCYHTVHCTLLWGVSWQYVCTATGNTGFKKHFPLPWSWCLYLVHSCASGREHDEYVLQQLLDSLREFIPLHRWSITLQWWQH